MMHLTYNEIVDIIKKEKDISDEDINQRVKSKLNQLSGLISKEGAAHIVANDLGIVLFKDVSKRKFKINKVIPGMRSLELIGKVLKKSDVREFQARNRAGKVGSFLLADDSGMIRIVLWGDQTKELDNIQDNDIVRLKNVAVRQNNGFNEIHFNERSMIMVNPEGEEIKDVVAYQEKTRKQIKDLSEGENVEVLGTIVQMFEPRFYEACPECNRKVEINDGAFSCSEHGHVKEKLLPILNFLFDDGTANIRAVCFRDLVGKLLGVKLDIDKLREDPSSFEGIKSNVLGKQVILSGRVKKNDLFDRVELTVNNVIEPDPKLIAAELVEEIQIK